MEAVAAKERPILFSGTMVRAILEGRKTMTRRVVKPQPPFCGDVAMPSPTVPGAWDFSSTQFPRASLRNFPVKNSYGQPGSRLWVRETWAEIHGDWGSEFVFAADYGDGSDIKAGVKYRPSIHMPRRVSRLTLAITATRIERLHSINWCDAIAEGIKDPRRANKRVDRENGPVGKFRELWESINSEREGCNWKSDPWVWVISFQRTA